MPDVNETQAREQVERSIGTKEERATVLEQTKTERAETIRKFKEKHPDKVTAVPNGTLADAERAAQNPTTAEAVEERVIEDKVFSMLVSRMANIGSYVTVMSLRDAVDYLAYADDLYNSEAKEDITKQWQRGRANSRINAAMSYLIDNPTHYFPPLLTVPANGNFRIGTDNVTLSAHSLGVLDGQHRLGAIELAIEKQPALANETIPVVILNIEDVEKRQQIFADVNGTPRKVSKALALAFDHTGKLPVLGKWLAKRPYMGAMVTIERVSPKGSDSQIMSLTNLTNLVKPMTEVKDSNGNPLLSDGDIDRVVEQIVESLPLINGTREGRVNFSTLKGEYILFYSTIWQALGQVIANIASKKHPETGEFVTSTDALPAAVRAFMDRVGKGFELSHKQWSTVDRNVVMGKKVGTQKDHVSNAVKILSDYVS